MREETCECGADLVFLEHRETKKQAPITKLTYARGNVVPDLMDGTYRLLRQGEAVPPDGLPVNHWSNCSVRGSNRFRGEPIGGILGAAPGGARVPPGGVEARRPADPPGRDGRPLPGGAGQAPDGGDHGDEGGGDDGARADRAHAPRRYVVEFPWEVFWRAQAIAEARAEWGRKRNTRTAEPISPSAEVMGVYGELALGRFLGFTWDFILENAALGHLEDNRLGVPKRAQFVLPGVQGHADSGGTLKAHGTNFKGHLWVKPYDKVRLHVLVEVDRLAPEAEIKGWIPLRRAKTYPVTESEGRTKAGAVYTRSGHSIPYGDLWPPQTLLARLGIEAPPEVVIAPPETEKVRVHLNYGGGRGEWIEIEGSRPLLNAEGEVAF